VGEPDRDLERHPWPEGDPVWHVQLGEGSQQEHRVVHRALNSNCAPIAWTASADDIIDKVRAVTSRMDALLRATEIDDVAPQAA
jgi:hypothetical protein